MKLYLYTWVETVSGSYHEDGGVVIVTARDPNKVWSEHWEAENDGEDEYCRVAASELGNPTLVCVTDVAEEKVFIFPNAGCC